MNCTRCGEWIEEGAIAYVVEEVLVTGEHTVDGVDPLSSGLICCVDCVTLAEARADGELS